jgi:flagellar basal-body rod protein FlgG
MQRGAIESTKKRWTRPLTEKASSALSRATGATQHKDRNFYYSDGYLVNSEGSYVLDSNFQRIGITGAPEDVVFSAQGSAGAVNLGVFTFSNKFALDRIGDSLFSANAVSGEPEAAKETIIMQGYLEASTVDVADEMTKMIVAQRGFQANARMLQTADEVEEITNRMRT